MTKKVRRKILSALFYPVYLIAMVLAFVYFIFWRPFVGELRDRRRPDSNHIGMLRHVDATVMKRLGHVRAKKRSSFVHFSRHKEGSILRICAFGDSYTYGDEVDESHDYPALLNELLSKNGISGVEVINFGSSGHGFHQAYMMWNAVGTNFDCDYVLFGPSCFQAERDTTFNHSNLDSPYYLHSRFVLRGGDVERVDVLGDDHTERFANYFRFFPHQRYLRYDASPPPILLSMIPEDHILPNPFYYRYGLQSEEAHHTYQLLLRRVAERSAAVVLGHFREEIVEIGNSLDRDNLVTVQILRPEPFLYRAPKGHCSALGNQFVAEQFYAQLVAGASPTLAVLTSSDVGFPADANPNRPSLSDYDRLEVELAGSPVGFFVSEEREDSWSNLKGTGIVSYLAIKNPATSLVDSFFVPLTFDIPATAELILTIASGDEEAPHVLAPVRWLDPRVNIAVAEVAGVQYQRRWESNRLYFKGNADLPEELLTQDGVKIDVWLGGKRILKGRQRTAGLLLKLQEGELHQLRAGEDHVLDVEELGPSGAFDLALHHPSHGVTRVPIAHWEKTAVTLPRPSRALPRPIEPW